MTTTEKKKLKITMSDRAPITIVQDDWDLVASAEWFSGQHECQANEIARIKVREHKDGRRIVYGFRDSGNGGMPIGYRGVYAGFLVAGPAHEEETVRAIRRVAGVIDMPELADECIGDLPAEELA